MKPPMFYGSRADEDFYDFINEFYKMLFTMGVTIGKNVKLAAYQLKDLAQTWYTQRRDNRVLRGGPVT